jgi:3beta-hydroxy-delta5-steroid dehydrogenase/steroid delta-isomerase
MGDSTLTTDLGRVLVTGGSGFVGANLVTELLARGHDVRSFDRAPSQLPDHPQLQTVVGDITDADDVAKAVADVDTVIHTAAIIDLMGGGSVTAEYRKRSFDVNVGGTQNLVYASNSVVMRGQVIADGDETLPYTERFNDLYTETKVAAEKFVLAANGGEDGAGMLTCSIRPSGIWGRGDQTMFRKVFENVLAGNVKVLVGSKEAKLDNSYVHNLIHGFILAGEHLVPGGSAPGQAYFVNDGDPINMFEFSRPIVEACGERLPKFRVPGRLVLFVMRVWQWLHFRFGLPKPPVEPLGVERISLNNYFSIAKAKRDLGYTPLFTTQQAMAECLPYYTDLYDSMKAVGQKAPATA